MKKQSSTLTRSEFIFFAAYILWLVVAVIKLTYLRDLMPFKTIEEHVGNIATLLLMIKFVEDDRYGFKGFVGMGLVGLLYYVTVQAKAEAILIPIYFVFSARNIDYRKLFRVTMAVQLILMAVSVSFSLTGIILNEIWDEETRARYSLGYLFCTYGSHISLFLTLMYISLMKKIKLVEVLFLLAWNFVWFEVTNTRIDLYLCIPAVVGCWLIGMIGESKRIVWDSRKKDIEADLVKDEIKAKRRKVKRAQKPLWENKIAQGLFMCMGPVIAGGALAMHWFYDVTNPRFVKIDVLLSGRLNLGRQAFDEYGVTIFGQYIKWIGRGSLKKHPDWIYNYVDCSYEKYLLHYGLLFFLLLMVGIVILAAVLWKERNLGLCIGFIVWLVYGSIDAELFELAFQPFMLLLGLAFKEVSNRIQIYKKLTMNSWRIENGKGNLGKEKYTC